MIALRFDDVVRTAVRDALVLYPQASLFELFISIVDSLETATADGAVRLVGPWVVVR